MKNVVLVILAGVLLSGYASLNFAGNEQAAEVAIEIAARRMTAVFCDKFPEDIDQGLAVTQKLFVALDTPDTPWKNEFDEMVAFFQVRIVDDPYLVEDVRSLMRLGKWEGPDSAPPDERYLKAAVYGMKSAFAIEQAKRR